MLFIGALFLLAALGALSVSLGIVGLPDRVVRARLLNASQLQVADEPAGRRT